MKQYSKSFIELVRELDKVEREPRDRGTLFELLITTYLSHEPIYNRLFDAVWTLDEVPVEYNIPKADTGVDLVARKRDTGELVAVQCKFYSKDTVIQKKHIDSFLNEVGKSYYSEGLIVTTADQWSQNADKALEDRDKKVYRLSLSDLAHSQIDWSSFSFEQPQETKLQVKKSPRPHQKPAIDAVVNGFENEDRGKLIMAPGTGKTFTSMAIAEQMAQKQDDKPFKVLYFVPSIQLLSQTVRSWNADIHGEMETIAVCSDRKVTKKGSGMEDIGAIDLGFPATTNSETLLSYQHSIEQRQSPDMIAVFSTYQSIDVLIDAQNKGFYDFDLIICDEAHRTTGATEQNQEESHFVKVHRNENIRANKRLYQTATPRVYGDDAKQKAESKSIVVADMNDPTIYGEEFYRIGFGDAVHNGILSDYKVMVLGVDEEVIARRFQSMLAHDNELEFDDVTKIIGCWNGLVKRNGESNETLGDPMKRAIAFTGTINDSKMITDMFSNVVEEYLNELNEEQRFHIDIQHADGSMNAVEKNAKIDWLQSEVPDNTCRVLSNARFLTEGVDVPELDAVMFLQPRRSKIDIAQAVGRVMRKAEHKDYGYIILPVGIPAGADETNVLDNNEKYRVVWDVLNALRSIDERFDATINKLELNNKKPQQLIASKVGDAPNDGLETPHEQREYQTELDLYGDEDLSDLERAIYGKIVRKVGNVRYWEQWSEDVVEIARKHIMRINVMLEDENSDAYKEFKKFVKSLHHNINDSITEQQAIEMLSQHLITKPIFEALFESNSFVNSNPVSQSMEAILNILDKQGLMKEQEKLEDFYESVRIRAEGIDNLEAKQKIIIQLYDKFFKIGFKETTERLGIVFTPVEVVDFIIKSVNGSLKQHFNKSITDEGVNILDPFTGTGTFITRLLQSGLILPKDMLRKYKHELYANEMVLLSYYIAAINIEETFNTLMETKEYEPFEGIVLTDTFESSEGENTLIDEYLSNNDKRLMEQKSNPITAIIGNPPYSARQTNDNDNNANNKHPMLEDAITNSYAKYLPSNGTKNTLYDSYIKAIRWATDRIGDAGVVGFITNSSFIDKPTTAGIRRSLEDEFNYVYIIDLKGSVKGKVKGEDMEKEGGNVFDIQTGVAIVLLVKDGSENHVVKYSDIGDYLSRDEKINKIDELESCFSEEIEFVEVKTDDNNDWINKRNPQFDYFSPIHKGIFYKKILGVSSSRDSWVYGFNKSEVINKTNRMVSNFNAEIESISKELLNGNEVKPNTDPSYIGWSRGLRKRFGEGEKIELDKHKVGLHLYRPFTKKWLYYDPQVIENGKEIKKYFGEDNLVLLIPGTGSRRNFSTLVSDCIPDLNIFDAGTQGFLLKFEDQSDDLFKSMNNLNEQELAKLELNEDEVFPYIYAILHSKDYLTQYKNNLKKAFPRIPALKNKHEFVKVGQKLMRLHLDYESVPMYSGVEVKYNNESPSYLVNKMKHPKRNQKDIIIFNNDITIYNIPDKAYEYLVNGKPAIQWIMEQYQVKQDKKTGIIDDPNDFSDDEKYIFNLLLRIINVSVQTVDLINNLPPLEIKGE